MFATVKKPLRAAKSEPEMADARRDRSTSVELESKYSGGRREHSGLLVMRNSRLSREMAEITRA